MAWKDPVKHLDRCHLAREAIEVALLSESKALIPSKQIPTPIATHIAAAYLRLFLESCHSFFIRPARARQIIIMLISIFF